MGCLYTERAEEGWICTRTERPTTWSYRQSGLGVTSRWGIDLVVVHSPEVSNNINYAEDQAGLGPHGKVGAALVAVDGVDLCLERQMVPHLQAAAPLAL